MKMTKQTIVALVTVTGALTWQPLAQAADKESVPPAAGQRLTQFRERMQDLGKELNLTDEQREKLKPIFQAQMEQARKLWQDKSLSLQEKMEKFKALRGASEPKLKELLTPEQLEKWQQRQTQARERMEAARKDWNITDEQKAKLKSTFQPQMEKFRELRQNQDLTSQEKMEKFKAMREELAPQIKEVLTPEQFEKWEKARAQRLEQARDRWQQRKQK